MATPMEITTRIFLQVIHEYSVVVFGDWVKELQQLIVDMVPEEHQADVLVRFRAMSDFEEGSVEVIGQWTRMETQEEAETRETKQIAYWRAMNDRAQAELDRREQKQAKLQSPEAQAAISVLTDLGLIVGIS